MEGPVGLAATFQAHARSAVLTGDAQALERLLGRAFESARARWPNVALPAEHFVRHLAERLPDGNEESQLGWLLNELRLDELYLACACTHVITGAAAAFEQHYLSKLPGRLRALKLSAAMIDDICQAVREKFLVSTDDRQPYIAAYEGKGELQNWMYVIAVRLARRWRRGDEPPAREDEAAALEALPSPGSDPEIELIRRSLQVELRSAVRDACTGLSEQERHLLRLHYVRRLSTAKLGTLFGVNQSTVSRWLASARQTIYEETKRLLQERLRLSSRDLESLVAEINSRLDLSISQLIGKADEETSTSH